MGWSSHDWEAPVAHAPSTTVPSCPDLPPLIYFVVRKEPLIKQLSREGYATWPPVALTAVNVLLWALNGILEAVSFTLKLTLRQGLPHQIHGQGAFSTYEQAMTACKDRTYKIVAFDLDVELPEERVDWPQEWRPISWLRRTTPSNTEIKQQIHDELLKCFTLLRE